MIPIRKPSALLLFTAALFAAAPPLFSQDTEPAAYIDFLFNDYIELEDSILLKGGPDTYNNEDLRKIELLEDKISGNSRPDLESRLSMLRFAVETGIADTAREAEAETVLESLLAEEQRLKKEAAAGRISRTTAGIAIGTAAVSGAVFAFSSLAASEFYSKYTRSDIAYQAAFYLFWWQTLDRVSLISAITALSMGTAAGILAALF